MIAVSEAYKSAMASPFRARGHARVDLGTHQVDPSGTATGDYYAGYQSGVAIGDRQKLKTARYAGLDLFCLDGSMILPAKDSNNQPVFQTTGDNAVGLISTKILSRNAVGSDEAERLSLQIDFSESLSWDGLTLIFDEVYPKIVVIQQNGYGAVTTHVLTSPILRVSRSFQNVTSLTITFRSPTSIANARVRLQGIVFGFYAHYEDDDIFSISWSETANPISAEFPNMDAEVVLQDSENLFDPDNEGGLLYTLDTTGVISIDFGMTLEDGNIEWIHMMDGVISSWSYSKGSLSVKCTDFFRTAEETLSMSYRDYTGRTEPDASITSGNQLNASVPVFTHFPLNGLVGHALDQAGLLDHGEEGATAQDAGYDVLESGVVFRAVIDRSVKDILQAAANVSHAMVYICRDGRLKMKQVSGDPVHVLSHYDILQSSDVNAPEKVKTVDVKLNGFESLRNASYDRHFITCYSFSDLYYYKTNTLVISQDDPIGDIDVKIYFVISSDLENGQMLDTLPEGYVNLDNMWNYNDLSEITLNVDVDKFTIGFDWSSSPSVYANGYFLFDVQIKTPKETFTSALFPVNDRGRQETWSNFLVCTEYRQTNVGEFVANHYRNFQQFEYDYRGNPELDVGDIISQQSPFGGEGYRKVVITSTHIDYDGSFSGHLVTKEVD